MSALNKLLREVVDPEIFRPKVLADDQNFHSISSIFLPHYTVHIVRIAMNNA